MATDLVKLLLLQLNAEQLELFTLAVVKTEHVCTQGPQRIGVQGQAQQGVDVHAIVAGRGNMGFQAKAYVRTRLTKANLEKELSLAHQFAPPLDHYTIITLNPRSADLQLAARKALLHGKQGRVSILALEDLAEIADQNALLKAQLMEMCLTASDRQALLKSFGIENATSLTPALSPDFQQLAPELRVAEEWVNNGMSLKALSILENASTAPPEQRFYLRCRAMYSLGNYKEVLREVEERTSPEANSIMIAALSAYELGDKNKSDQLAERAILLSNSSNRKDVTGAYIRLKARKGSATISELENIASTQVDDIKHLSVALADSAAILGEFSRAHHWYGIARETRPGLPLPVKVNELATKLRLTLISEQHDKLGTLLDEFKVVAEACERADSPSLRIAALINLGLIYSALKRPLEAAQSWDQALELDNEKAEKDLWVRRCILSAEQGAPLPPPVLQEKYGHTPLNKLAFASALARSNQENAAVVLIDSVIAGPGIDPETLAIAHAEKLEIFVKGSLGEDAVSQALSILTKLGSQAPLLAWLAMHYSSAHADEKQKIKDAFEAVDITQLSDQQISTLASIVAQEEFIGVLCGWQARLTTIAFHQDGAIADPDAAEALAALQLAAHDFAAAINTRRQLLDDRPTKPNAVLRLAEAQFIWGDRLGAFDTLQEALANGLASIAVLANWANLACALGKKKEARKKISSFSKPEPQSAHDYVRLFQVNMALGLEPADDDALGALRQGLVNASNAGPFFGMGVRNSKRRTVVRYESFVRLELEGKLDEILLLTESPSPGLPGVRTLDTHSYPWIRELIGRREGETITLKQAPFEGKAARLVEVMSPTDYLAKESVRQIAISPSSSTGVESIEGPIENQIKVAKEKLEKRKLDVSKRLKLAGQAAVPIALMADLFHTSPREFISSSDEWSPKAHSGTDDEIRADDNVLANSNSYVLDATTILLMAAIGATEIPFLVPNKFVVTTQIVWQLYDWYLAEKESRKAAGHIGLADDGTIIFTEYGASERLARLAFWRRVKAIVRGCDIVDTPSCAPDRRTASFRDCLTGPSLGSIHLAKNKGFAFISEEASVRAMASKGVVAKSSSLQRLIFRLVSLNAVGSPDASKWLAHLISMGWSWVTFTREMLEEALAMPEPDCWTRIDPFLSRLPNGPSRLVLDIVFQTLRKADLGEMGHLDADRLRASLLRALPKVDAKLRLSEIKKYRRRMGKHANAATLNDLEAWAAQRNEV